MAGELKNISKLFQNSRTRAIVIVTAGVILFAVVLGIISLKKRLPGPATKVELQATPTSITSIPGGFEKPETAEYAKLQNQQNVQQAERAQRTGTSAVPTIISATTETGGWQGGRPAPSGNYLLRKSVPADSEAVPVYDQQGSVSGLAYGNPNGRLCIVGCSTTGSIGPDGLIRDAKGNVIGRLATSALGTPVYDAQGHLIGYAGADGKVRDAKGNLIGTIGPNGVFKSNAGRLGGALGVPVYDADGRLIGYASPDGTVRGLNGNVLGKQGTDGAVRDALGRILGRVGGGAFSGTPVYDTQGRLLGSADAGGVVRDANGKVVGNLAADGSLRDANGNVIGGVTPPAPPAAASTVPSAIAPAAGIGAPSETDQLQAVRLRQAQQVEQQRMQQNQQQLSSAMTSQQTLLFTAWATTPTQQYVAGEKKEEREKSRGVGQASGGSTEEAANTTLSMLGSKGPPLLKAGAVLYAVLVTSVSSDEPGPVMATVVGTQFKGAKLLGTLVNQGQKVLLTFNVMTLPDVDKSISINAIAIDPDTARTALSSDTDNHYLLRYGSLFASALMQGYGQAILQSGATVVSNGLNTVTTSPTLSNKQQLLSALGTVGQNWSAVVRPIFNTPPTVQVYGGTGLGILLLADVAPPT